MNVNYSMVIPGFVGSLLFLIFSGCNKSIARTSDTGNGRFLETKSGLKYRVVSQGHGPGAKNSDEVMLYETTSYRDGTQLYSNEGSGNAIKIELGANQVTAGVEEGLLGMKAGEIKELIVPPYLAKRAFYPDNISPDSILIIKLIVDEVVERNQEH